MSRVLEVPVVDGSSVLVEVDAVGDGPALRGRGAPMPATVSEPLAQLLAGVGPATRAMLGELSALAESPYELEVEFGVKLSADAKIVIARAGGEAHFRIALKMSRPARHPPGGLPESGW